MLSLKCIQVRGGNCCSLEIKRCLNLHLPRCALLRSKEIAREIPANSNSMGHPSFFSVHHLQPRSVIYRHPRRRHFMPPSRAVCCCWPHSALMLRRSINFCACKNCRVAHRIAVSCRFLLLLSLHCLMDKFGVFQGACMALVRSDRSCQ